MKENYRDQLESFLLISAEARVVSALLVSSLLSVRCSLLLLPFLPDSLASSHFLGILEVVIALYFGLCVSKQHTHTNTGCIDQAN